MLGRQLKFDDLAPRERRADAEVLEQLVVDAGDHFVRLRHVVVADLVEACDLPGLLMSNPVQSAT